nr:S8 family peptidase [Oceanococcus sp. HetDA_MAG_MS8]
MNTWIRYGFAVAATGLAAYAANFSVSLSGEQRFAYVAWGPNVAESLEAVGARIISEQPSLGTWGVRLSASEVVALQAQNPQLKLFADGPLFSIADRENSNASQPEQEWQPAAVVPWVRASAVHNMGIDGAGIGVAFIDTGVWGRVANLPRVFGEVSSVGEDIPPQGAELQSGSQDRHGHASHLISHVVGADRREHQAGVAPGAHIYSVRAFDDDGLGRYIDVLEGIDWVIRNANELNIRVLNLSFGAPVQSHYWDDPINQAVMRAWDAGIVVVTSAGNTGPDPQSITVPGNLPYVITVGAVSDNGTPRNLSDDFITSFSAAGPTLEAFVKPDLVAPGDRILGAAHPRSTLAQSNGGAGEVRSGVYALSGTSQAAAITSGVAALLLQAQPHLTPDDVKCKLIATARAAVNPNGEAAISVFQQGAGLLDAEAALVSDASQCANVGLDISLELADKTHFLGRARFDEERQQYFIADDHNDPLNFPGSTWEKVTSVEGDPWGGGYVLAQGDPWGGGYFSRMSLELGSGLSLSYAATPYSADEDVDSMLREYLVIEGDPWGGGYSQLFAYPDVADHEPLRR